MRAPCDGGIMHNRGGGFPRITSWLSWRTAVILYFLYGLRHRIAAELFLGTARFRATREDFFAVQRSKEMTLCGTRSMKSCRP